MSDSPECTHTSCDDEKASWAAYVDDFSGVLAECAQDWWTIESLTRKRPCSCPPMNARRPLPLCTTDSTSSRSLEDCGTTEGWSSRMGSSANGKINHEICQVRKTVRVGAKEKNQDRDMLQQLNVSWAGMKQVRMFHVALKIDIVDWFFFLHRWKQSFLEQFQLSAHQTSTTSVWNRRKLFEKWMLIANVMENVMAWH